MICSAPDDCPQGVCDLWRRCVAREPGERPSSAEVVSALEALLLVKRPMQATPRCACLAEHCPGMGRMPGGCESAAEVVAVLLALFMQNPRARFRQTSMELLIHHKLKLQWLVTCQP